MWVVAEDLHRTASEMLGRHGVLIKAHDLHIVCPASGEALWLLTARTVEPVQALPEELEGELDLPLRGDHAANDAGSWSSDGHTG